MEIPPKYDVPCGRNKVCKLKKPLYGLKQSPRASFGIFTKTMESQKAFIWVETVTSCFVWDIHKDNGVTRIQAESRGSYPLS